MEDHATGQLHVEMPLSQGSLGRLAYHGEGLWKQIIKLLIVRQPLPKSGGLGL